MNFHVENQQPEDISMMAVLGVLCSLAYVRLHEALAAGEWEREYSGCLYRRRGIPRGCRMNGKELKHSGQKPGIYRDFQGRHEFL